MTKPKTATTAQSMSCMHELREVAVQETADAVRAVELHHLFAHDAVPARAVLAGGEDADGDHAPQAVDAVDRDRADRIVDTPLLPEEDTQHDEDAGDRTDDRRAQRIDECARRGDRHEAGQHAVAHHRRIGLQALCMSSNHVRADRAR